MANRLSQEKSPYLLQHQHNPVDWYPWGSEAFERARNEDKPILLSIGYSTCYWCHVMERDSFEHDEVAQILNDGFISIKVDREEHPEVDQIYMEAVVALTGHGGWPMTVFLTPDRKPFFGGTFFPRAQFIELLDRVNSFWKNHRAELDESANKITRVIAAHVTKEPTETIDSSLFELASKKLLESFDSEFGGFGESPKFPPHSSLPFLFREAQRAQDAALSNCAEFTLQAMAMGGIFDHLGGGFHRYSTDREWLVPHFEKMLYDNALLATNYCTAYRASENPIYKDVAELTLDYLLRDMQDPVGGFHSAEDAGDVGDEGSYYTWTRSEIANILPETIIPLFNTAFGVTERGQFEGRNVLAIRRPYAWGIRLELREALRQLKDARSLRKPPHRDDKILTGWNGLAIEALSNGYQITGNQKYLDAATRCANFLKNTMWDGTLLLRRYRDGESRFEGSLEDYAYLICGLISLYQSDFDPNWLRWALELQTKQNEYFLDRERGGYFYAAPSADILFRRKDFIDSATPSPNAVSAQNLLRLFQYTGESELYEQAKRLLQLGAAEIDRYPSAFTSLLMSLDRLRSGGNEFVIASTPNSDRGSISEELKALWNSYLPITVLALTDGTQEFPPLIRGRKPRSEGSDLGNSMFYVCKKMSCEAPTDSFETALANLQRVSSD